ncbi:MAG: hypothetical protein H7Y17_11855 [Chlorobia bacterium]|nr:hypothetical protein [Fimbriimonadaceae bacterium]
MDSKNVCLSLLDAESEAQALAILMTVPEVADPKNWCPLDRRETNFNITSNQASDGGKALTELMTNMVDAVLMRAAKDHGVVATAKTAPKTMYDAVDKFVKNLRGGKLVNLDYRDPWLKDFAQKNLVIGITGARSKAAGLPCYTFVDNGEGQHPVDFEGTFLSLSAGTKKSIPFVQGKFNMGSSGVLGYCGRHWLKLIVSRRFDGTGHWGWTIMRRRPGNKDDLPIAEYLVPGGSIPSFPAEELFPFKTSKGKRYEGVHLKTGSIIKLYDYQVGSKFLSFKGSRDALNENLVETILPFRILDLRQTPDAKRTGDRALGVDPRPFYGMEFLLLNSHREEGADDEDEAAGTGKIFVGKFTDPDLGEVSISAIGLKRDLPGWLKSSNNRVFHTVNGQVQFKQTRGYLSNCGFPALKDRVVLIVDASGLSFSAHNEVWKGDREHIRSTIDGERYREEVTRTIRESEMLKQLQAKVAQEELERAAKTESNSLFQKLVDKDPTLAGLLSSRDPTIRLPSSGGRKGGKEIGDDEFEGAYSPSFVRFEEKFESGLTVPINLTRPVVARTDAENGYLQRTDIPGRVILPESLRENFTVREHLKDGKLTLFFEPSAGKAKVGDIYLLQVSLHDAGMPEAVRTTEIKLTVGDVVIVENKEPGERSENKSGDEGDKPGKGKDAPMRGIPPCILLTRDGRLIQEQETEQWPKDFTDADGGLIDDLGDGNVVYKINYDNVYHLKYRMSQHGSIARDVVTEKFILGMRITLMGYEHAYRSQKKAMGPEANGLDEFADEFRRMAARGAASTVLALAENLPKIVDATSVQADVE